MLNLIRLSNPDSRLMGRPNGELSLNNIYPPLYYVSMAGLHKSVQMLLDKGADVNAQGGFYDNALQAASV